MSGLWMSIPAIFTLLDIGFSRSVVAFRVVLLSAPFRLSKPMNSPLWIVRLTSDIAANPPYIFVKPISL